MPGRIALVPVVVGFLMADRAAAQGPAAADLRRWDFALDGVRYRIRLPRRAVVTSEADRFSVSMSERLIRQFHLRPAPPVSGGTYARWEELSNGTVVRYSVERPAGGGSGGPEASLKGELVLGTRRLAVTCHDQRELPAPDPTWCFRFLRYLRIDKVG
jgi:hypothetical protein